MSKVRGKTLMPNKNAKKRTMRNMRRAYQLDLFSGKPIVEEHPTDDGQVLPFDFETYPLRAVKHGDEFWFVASDACRIADYQNTHQALDRLDDDEKGVCSIYTLGGTQEVSIISEAGLYNLILGARRNDDKPQLQRFKRWVTHELLPTLRRTGSYEMTPRSRRVAQIRRQLGCDKETAEVRYDQYQTNREDNERLFSEGAGSHHIASWHNAGYRPLGGTAKELRPRLGLKPDETPLNRMAKVPLSINHHAKVMTNRICEARKQAGNPLAFEDRARLLEDVCTKQVAHDLPQLGPRTRIDVVDDAARGKILDVVGVEMLVTNRETTAAIG